MPAPQTAPPNATTLLHLARVNLQHGEQIILQNINLAVRAAEIVTLIGPNGAGKSSLLRIGLGLLAPNSGEVQRARDMVVGYVPQTVAFDPVLPLSVARFLNLERRYPPARAAEMLTQTGGPELGARLNAPMQTLSGGELRRVLLARALLRDPDLLILDEPGAGMDISGQINLYQLIQRIRDERGCGILLVSHDLYMVMAATDRVFCLNRHLCCSGKPEAVQQHPEFLALFGARAAAELAIYPHRHDHEHGLRGQPQPPPPARDAGHGCQ